MICGFCDERRDGRGRQRGGLAYNRRMSQLSISQVARQVGLRPSAIRYYEQMGILLPAPRRGGQRRYSPEVLYRLAIVQRARRTGFTLDEIRRLFFGFRKVTPVSERWRRLSVQKLAELESMAEQIRGMQRLLQQMMSVCHCETLDQCGRGIFRSDYQGKPLPAATRRPHSC
jgi:MerR family transcriptional regulator, redox-sensitive transcriptional activator SoxR